MQRLVETVRATPNGFEFRFVAAPVPPPAASGMFDLSRTAAADTGFGCRDPNALQVRRRGENEISFPNCPGLPLSADPLPRPLKNETRGDAAMTRTVARLLAESLEAHDVDQIFCVPGESYVGLSSVLVERNSIRMIVCRHEGGAGFMAVADGRLRNRAGVAIVSRGPGLSNAMVSLHSAYHDATPMVMLVGQVERHDFGRQALQEQNYSKLLSDITKAVIEVNEPEQASEAIARAFHLAESGTPGPVAVILPEDIFDEATDAELNQPRPRVVAGPRGSDLERLADMLAAGGAAADPGGRRAAGGQPVRPGGVRRSAPAGGGLGAADLPHPSPPATVRRAASRTTAATWASACRATCSAR